MVLPKGYISVSQVNTYLRCPAQYYFRYVLDIVIPPSASITKGKAVHAGIEYNYQQKIETKKDLPLNVVKDYTAATFIEMAVETDFQGTDKGKELDSAVKLVELYQTEVAPNIQPVAVEQKVEITFDNVDYILLGYIDVVDDNGNIRDTKTVARTPTEEVILNSLQLSAYSLAYRQLTGKEENSVILDYLVDNKYPKYVQFSAKRTMQDIYRFLKILGMVADNIARQNFYPNPTNYLCSQKACGYWDMCQLEW